MGPLCRFNKKWRIHVRLWYSSLAAGAVIPESPSVIVVHEARKQLPKARGSSSHMGIDKAFEYVFVSPKSKRQKIVQHWQRTGMLYTQLGEWCKDESGLEKAPSNAVLCSWMTQKPEKRNQLLKFLETETCPAKLSAKANYLPDHPLKMNYSMIRKIICFC